jgi:hypothetical protein
VEGEASAWVGLPLGDASDDAAFDVQLGLRLELISDDVRGGLLTRVVFDTLSDGGDRAQVSIAPYLRWDFSNTFVEAALTVNLDSPSGFAFSQGGVWSLDLAFGGKYQGTLGDDESPTSAVPQRDARPGSAARLPPSGAAPIL